MMNSSINFINSNSSNFTLEIDNRRYRIVKTSICSLLNWKMKNLTDKSWLGTIYEID